MSERNSFRERLGYYLSRITPQRVVGASGLAVLCAGSTLAFAPISGQMPSVALGQFLAGLGLNVLASVLQNAYQNLLSQPTDDDLDRLERIARLITPAIQDQPKLRSEIGEFLETLDAVQIAKEVVKGNPATHGWLLMQIYQEVNQHRAEFDRIHKTLAEIKALNLQLLPNLHPTSEYPLTVPQIPPQGVFGRETDLRTLQQLLAFKDVQTDVPPVCLLGMGGIGKTTLATALGRFPGITQVFPHGILWTELGPKPIIRLRLDEWGKQVGLDLAPLPDEEACSRRLRDALYHRHALIIVDDVWDSAAGQLFKVGGPNCRMLFVTRELPIANDLVTPNRIYRVNTISPAAALAFLRTLAPHVVSTDESAAKLLCKKLEFLPLAITLAGRYLANEALTHRRKKMLVQGLLSSADERLALPQFENRLSIEDARPSLRAILGLSVERLDHIDQERFAMLSVFGSEPLSWKESAAAFLWDCNEDEADATITRLIQHGLVEQWKDRYRMHALFADYAYVLREEWKL